MSSSGLPVNISAYIRDYSELAESVSLSLTSEGIIIDFFKNGKLLTTIAKTYDEFIEDAQDRIADIRDSIARHPTSYNG